MTPKRYNTLLDLVSKESKPTYDLMRTTPIEITISQIICPNPPPKKLGVYFCKTGFIGNLASGPLEFRNKQTGDMITFQNVSSTLQGDDFSKAMHLYLNGDIESKKIPAGKDSKFTFDGNIFHFWTDEGKWNREGAQLQGNLTLNMIPVYPVMGVFPFEQQTRENVQAILGQFVNARATVDMTKHAGPITVDLKASNFKALLPLVLHANRTLTLANRIEAEITLTPEVSETFLADINPLIITGARSDHPIKLIIDPEGFEIKVRPFSLSGINIEKASIDIGKIQVRNGG